MAAVNTGFLTSSQWGARDVQKPLVCEFMQLSLCAASIRSAEGTLFKAMLEKLSCIFPQAEIPRGQDVVEAILRHPPYKAALVPKHR